MYLIGIGQWNLTLINEIIYNIFVLFFDKTSGIIKFMKLLLWGLWRQKKITLIQLAKLTGISKTSLNEFENGNRVPNLEQLERIAMTLEVRMSDLYESDYK